MGAQYFTVRDDGFRARVAAWAVAGLVARWPAAGAEAWVGVPGMRSPLKDAAAGLDVRSGVMVTALEREGAAWRVAGEVFDAVVLAVPAENAGPLLAPFDAEAAALAGATAAAPCWTVMAAFGERLEAGDVLRGAGAVGWAARESAKPGRSGLEAWVIQAGPEWSRAALEAGCGGGGAAAVGGVRGGVRAVAAAGAGRVGALMAVCAVGGRPGRGICGGRRCTWGCAGTGWWGRGWRRRGSRGMGWGRPSDENKSQCSPQLAFELRLSCIY